MWVYINFFPLSFSHISLRPGAERAFCWTFSCSPCAGICFELNISYKGLFWIVLNCTCCILSVCSLVSVIIWDGLFACEQILGRGQILFKQCLIYPLNVTCGQWAWGVYIWTTAHTCINASWLCFVSGFTSCWMFLTFLKWTVKYLNTETELKYFLHTDLVAVSAAHQCSSDFHTTHALFFFLKCQGQVVRRKMWNVCGIFIPKEVLSA